MNAIVFTNQLGQHLERIVAETAPDRVFVLTDENTCKCCWPLVAATKGIEHATLLTIAAGDEHKTLDTVASLWQQLQTAGASRHSLLINLGGGMLTDLGGFVASTFKRGLPFINIPTTLLAMIDASVGGKTGFNFGGLKNEIGVFRQADAVIVDSRFLDTLDEQNIRSGFAEMLKHALLHSTAQWAALLNHPFTFTPDLLRENVAVKEAIVEQDPTEAGLRKALNLGHTAGHAFESLSMLRQKPVLHGYAVAYGLVCELYLSVVKAGFPTERMRQTVRFIHEHYGRMPISCNDYPTLLELMQHDKKNTGSTINFTLLADIGDVRINQTATKAEIEEALDFYREG